MDQLLPIAPAGAIRSNSFGPSATNCSRGSNSEQFIWTNCSLLLPLERFGDVRLDQLLPREAGAIRSNVFRPIAPNCSRGSNSELFVWTNCSQLLRRERLSNSIGSIAPNCSRGSNSEQFVWTNLSQLLPREPFGAIHLDQLLPIAPAGAIRSDSVGPIAPQLLPREQFGAIRLDQLLPIAPAGAIRSNLFGPIAPKCSRGSNSEQFVWTNCSQSLPLEQFGEIG